MNEDEFFAALKETTKLFRWFLRPYFSSPCRLRADTVIAVSDPKVEHLSDHFCFCPITAVAVHRGVRDPRVALTSWRTAAALLGMSQTLGRQLMVASDYERTDPDYRPALRARLLATCGLTEVAA